MSKKNSSDVKAKKTKSFLAETEEKRPKNAKNRDEESEEEEESLSIDDSGDDSMKDFIVDDDEESVYESEADERPSPKKRKIEEDEESKNGGSVSSTSGQKKVRRSPIDEATAEFTIIDVESTIDNWYEDFREFVLNDEDQKKIFLEDFAGCDFVSNYELRFFAHDALLKAYEETLTKKVYTQDRRKSIEHGRELLRLAHARKIRSELAANGIDIVGFASESRRKSSSNKDGSVAPSCHAVGLPSGYKREEDGKSKAGKMAKIVYVGEKSQIVKAKNNTSVVPRTRVNLLPKHVVYYPPTIVKLVRDSALQKMYEDLQAKHPDILMPFERVAARMNEERKRHQ